MERISIKTYATRNKLSIFHVVKMIKTGKLKSETVEEEGREVTYILIEDSEKTGISTERSASVASHVTPLEKRVSQLEKEVAILKREMDALKISIGLQT